MIILQAQEECNSKTCFENIWYSNEIDLWDRMTRGILADAVIVPDRALIFNEDDVNASV